MALSAFHIAEASGPQLSKMHQLVHINAALERWANVRPEQIVPGLAYYRCGSAACFGGHVAQWGDLFPGVSTSVPPGGRGFPTMQVAGRTLMPGEIAYYLFGDGHLFCTRGAHPIDSTLPMEATDHTVVAVRLATQRERLMSYIEQYEDEA